MALFQLHNGDCVEGMRALASDSVDLVVTSPPYKDEDDYTPELMRGWLREAYRCLRPNTALFLNFGHLANFKGRPFEVAQMAVEAGFVWNDTITWVKNHYRPIQGNRRVNNLTEFIFLMTKGNNVQLNRLAIGVPYVNKANIAKFKSVKGDNKCRGNVWNVGYETLNNTKKKRHNDRFPVRIPEMAIQICGYGVEVVLDPFTGSGTVGVAAVKMGKRFVGFEKNQAHYDYAREWLSKETVRYYTAIFDNFMNFAG